MALFWQTWTAFPGLQSSNQERDASMRDNLVVTQREADRRGAMLRALPASPWIAAVLAAAFVVVLPHLAPAFGVPAPLRSALTDLRNPAACPASGIRDTAGPAPEASAPLYLSDARSPVRCAERGGPGRMG